MKVTVFMIIVGIIFLCIFVAGLRCRPSPVWLISFMEVTAYGKKQN